VVLRGWLGAGWWLAPHVALGLAVPVEAGYLFKNGGGAAVNDADGRYAELAIAALVTLRLNLRLR
jgi:hypothetical protein